jgi:peptidoglycan/LPS O-acetylase OafA/YrhL
VQSTANQLLAKHLLPALLFLQRRVPVALGYILLLAVCLRTYLYIDIGEVQSSAYWTIVGRIDQFILGIVGFHARMNFTGRNKLIMVISLLFLSLYYWFDVQGGFYLNPTYPSPARIWILLPTLEGITFASLIAWYDTSFTHSQGILSTALSKVGEYSYSIYLLHFFIVFRAAEWIHHNLLELSSFYVALPVSVLAFAAMVPIGYLSMKLIEGPFLKLRRQYYLNTLVKNNTS